MALGNRVREYRQAADKTTREIAEAIGCDHSQLVRLENGQRGVSDEIKVALAEYFHVPITELFYIRDGVSETPEEVAG
jgi:transcriptional regulator with XRE-family HTH domain